MLQHIVLIIPHFFTVLGFLLALFLLVHLLRSDKSPSTTLAWLLSILLVPYLGVPLYIMFGGRKMRKMIAKKDRFFQAVPKAEGFVGQEDMRFHFPFIFPVHENNNLELISTGEDTYAKLIELIEHSKKSIYITTYILGMDQTADKVLELLTKKAKEGVEVCLLLDALGCFYIKKKHLKVLKEAGGRYAYFMPMLRLPFRGRANLRNHRKMVLVDHEIAIVGGMNIAKEYMGEKPDLQRWIDLSFLVEGPVISDFYDIFYSDWKFASNGDVLQQEKEQVKENLKKQDLSSLQVMPSGPDVAGDFLLEAILASVFRAKERIWIVTPYFIPNEILLTALCVAAKQGVDVKVIIPKKSNHPLADLVRRDYLRQLQNSGADVLKYTERMLHAKLIIVDNELAITGSANMDVRSLLLNYEIALFIYNRDEVKELSDWLESIRKKCERGVSPSTPLIDILEGVGRLFAPLL